MAITLVPLATINPKLVFTKLAAFLALNSSFENKKSGRDIKNTNVHIINEKDETIIANTWTGGTSYSVSLLILESGGPLMPWRFPIACSSLISEKS